MNSLGTPLVLGLPAFDGTSISFLNVVPSVIFKGLAQFCSFWPHWKSCSLWKKKKEQEWVWERERALKCSMNLMTFLRVRFSFWDDIFCSSHWSDHREGKFSPHQELPVILDVHQQVKIIRVGKSYGCLYNSQLAPRAFNSYDPLALPLPRPMVLNWEWFCAPVDIWQCLETFLVGSVLLASSG